MKGIKSNIIPNITLMIIGVIILGIQTIFQFDGNLGWGLTWGGRMLIVIGIIYKIKNPIKAIVELILQFF